MIHIQVTKVVEILHHFRSFRVENFLSALDKSLLLVGLKPSPVL